MAIIDVRTAKPVFHSGILRDYLTIHFVLVNVHSLQYFFFLRMGLRCIIDQPGNSSISRVKLRQTTIQLSKRAVFDDVGHRLGLTTGA